MATRSLHLQLPRGAPVAAAGVLTAGVVGVALAAETPMGIALLLGVLYAPLAILDIRLGIALWVPLTFLDGVPAFNMGGKAGGLLLLAAWVGALRSGMADTEVIRRHRRTFEALVLLNVWLTLSLLWATDTGRALDDVWHWWAVALVFALVATAITTRRSARHLAVGFVAGAILSVLVGVASGDLTRTAGAAARLGSATDDPNFLAAGLVAGLVLAASLMVGTRNPLARVGLFAGMALMAVGIVSSQSRGGMLAGVATALAAVVFFRRRRIHALAAVLLTFGAGAMAFALNPESWERVTGLDNGGSGRQDLWTVAWKIFVDNPVMGVGVNNFGAVTPEYVRDGGALQRVDLVAESPHFVHNVYLQLLAENGLVGLLLLTAFVFGCLRAAYLAGRAFEALGDMRMEALSHGVLVAAIGQLAAAIFISSTVDRRMWILFAMGPALLAIAHRREAPPGRVAVA